MEEVRKLLELSKQIEKIYSDLIQMEYIGFAYNKKFEEKIEVLRLYKEVEERYINIIKDKYKSEEIFAFARAINTDNVLEKNLNNWSFISEYLFNDNIKKQYVIARRVYNRLFDIIVSKMSNDELLDYMDIKNESFYMKGRKIYILDRAHTLYQINCNAEDNIDLKYLLFIQLNINSNFFKDVFLIDKYYLLFVSKALEDLMIEHDFCFSEIEVINHKENYPLNQELYDYYLKMESTELFINLINRNLDLKNQDLQNKNIDNILLLLIDDALIRAVALKTSDEIKDNVKNELENMSDESNIVVRKHLIKTIEETKKDKIYLKS